MEGTFNIRLHPSSSVFHPVYLPIHRVETQALIRMMSMQNISNWPRSGETLKTSGAPDTCLMLSLSIIHIILLSLKAIILYLADICR